MKNRGPTVSVFEAIITGDRCQARVRDDAFAREKARRAAQTDADRRAADHRAFVELRLFTPGRAAEPDPIKRVFWPSVVRVYAVTHETAVRRAVAIVNEYDRDGIGGGR